MMTNQVYTKLNQMHLNPYYTGQHRGLVRSPHVIIRQGPQIAQIGTNKVGQTQIDIILFVPIESYIKLEPYKKLVIAALKELKWLRKTGFETPVIVEDDKKAYSMSMEYVIQKKLEG